MSILVTGGAGFIGGNFVLDWFAGGRDEKLINLDALTYAGNLLTLQSLARDKRHIFVQGDINDSALLARLLRRHRPRAVIHFAAESHVDRSIHGPEAFMRANILGTFALLQSVRTYWQALDEAERAVFRFLHVSTDEVFGSLSADAPAFTESHPYEPNSPYAASKASSDHLVRAWHHTFGLPTLISHCSNNYGPFQFPEKLIPLMIHNALAGKPLPVYGDGRQVRDWLYVGDHCQALCTILEKGAPGRSYNIGGESETDNLTTVRTLCALLDELRPRADGQSYAEQVTFVTDRPGHDRRYAMDIRRIRAELGWRPAQSFADGLRATVLWYLQNPDWVQSVTSGTYRQWVNLQYGTGAKSTRTKKSSARTSKATSRVKRSTKR